MSDELKDLRVSNDAMDDRAELQRRMADEGYLFFKQLQSPDKLRELRQEMMATIQRAGWIAGMPVGDIAGPPGLGVAYGAITATVLVLLLRQRGEIGPSARLTTTASS